MTDDDRALFLTYLQAENGCKATGQPCRECQKCGCYLEMDEYISTHSPAVRGGGHD